MKLSPDQQPPDGKRQFPLSPRVVGIMALLVFGWVSVVSSQSFQEVRRVLSLRERLDMMQRELNRMATVEMSGLEEGFLRQSAEFLRELQRMDDEIDSLRDMRGPLATHYFNSLRRQVVDNRALLEKLQERLAIFRTPPESTPPVTVTPVAGTPVTGSESAEKPADATPSPPVPAAGETSVAALSGPVDPLLEPQARKLFFHPIWPRLLIPRSTKPGGIAAPPRTSPAGDKPVTVVGVPGKIPGKPAYVFPKNLPKPVDKAPASITPLAPWPTGDPQVRETRGMRPLAIMIENHNKARPQTGLGEAEVVYEIPVEGGITRFMALFYHVIDKIGPVRSCRDYFIDRALEVNALYVHCGGSPQGYKYIAQSKVFAVDEISFGVPFFRDSIRKAPHNLYAYMQKLIDQAHKRHPMELPYQKLPFLYGAKPHLGTIGNRGVSIRYHGNYSVTYRFNDRLNVYDRYMNGDQHLDRASLLPVSPGTVIVQEAAMKVIDDVGRQDISFIGQGKAYILSGGTIFRTVWKKTAPREFTRFYDEKGNQVVFSSKKPIWVQVVSPALPVVFDPPIPAEWEKENLLAKQ